MTTDTFLRSTLALFVRSSSGRAPVLQLPELARPAGARLQRPSRRATAAFACLPRGSYGAAAAAALVPGVPCWAASSPFVSRGGPVRCLFFGCISTRMRAFSPRRWLWQPPIGLQSPGKHALSRGPRTLRTGSAFALREKSKPARRTNRRCTRVSSGHYQLHCKFKRTWLTSAAGRRAGRVRPGQL
jgi:hypothetical protein